MRDMSPDSMAQGSDERTLHVQGRVDDRATLPLMGLGVLAAAGLALAVPLIWAAGIAALAWGCAALLLSDGHALWVAAGAPVGLVLLVAMLRPVLGAPVPRAGRLALGPREAPAFRRFLNEVAIALRTRAPRLIAVDAGVGVSVEQGRLILGLGLLAAVDRQTLAGLVGAELARTGDQRLAGRAAALIEQVDDWLARATAGRDRWALVLDRLRAGEGLWRVGRPLAWA
ncbi:MAG: hypothetical protein KC613_18630, partial [Myxococcales bacterium]|nr:hypothetical protein [Myxococcales bacterium]